MLPFVSSHSSFDPTLCIRRKTKMVHKITIDERRYIFDLYKTNSARRTAQLFNEAHPNRPPIVQSTVSKLIAKFQQTGSLQNRRRSGRPSKRRDAEVQFNVLAHFIENPRISTRAVAVNMQISQKVVLDILHDHRFFPYKGRRLHFMEENQKPPRLAFAQEMREMLDNEEDILSRTLFTDESMFVLRHSFNTQNSR